MKLQHDDPDGLDTFEALEFLTLGFLGKRALWGTLALLARHDSRLAGWTSSSSRRRKTVPISPILSVVSPVGGTLPWSD